MVVTLHTPPFRMTYFRPSDEVGSSQAVLGPLCGNDDYVQRGDYPVADRIPSGRRRRHALLRLHRRCRLRR